jgi:hypothetical protein
MPGVGDEPPLALEGRLEPGQHGIEGVGQLAQFVTRATQGDPGGQVVFRRAAGGLGDLLDRSQDPAGGDPPGQRGQQRGRGEREQRVPQQVRQGRFALVVGGCVGGLPERLLALSEQLVIFEWAHRPVPYRGPEAGKRVRTFRW